MDVSSGARWLTWLAGGVGILLALLAVAWTTGAFAAPVHGPGDCFDYDAIDAAEGAPRVSCDEPHTAQMVAFLAPAIDEAVSQRQCRSAVGVWVVAKARTSKARSAYRHLLVPIDAPWRRSGFRCDVVRAEYRGRQGDWVPGTVTGSAQGMLAKDPASWVQCRKRTGSSGGASTDCARSRKKVLEFAFSVKTKGEYRADAARRAAMDKCRSTAKDEVVSRAEPIGVSPIEPGVWESTDRAPSACTFTTNSWRKAPK
jgi:hypothetical protein